ncbi:hypothetical protein Q9314_03230 [Shinella sumterensis]|nr:hypothetical protein [Shinella sp.]WLS10028.1 hypothetical protein Q9314_03230 [Shinella sumterensis]
MMRKDKILLAIAIAHTLTIVSLGYILLGFAGMALFAIGFVIGLVFWLAAPEGIGFRRIRLPYFLTLVFFVLHKIEEREMDFFPAFSRLTGVATPEEGSPLSLLLYALAAAWLLVPILLRWRNPLGEYLAWTFFASTGLIELAHFVFPTFEDRPYGYFPGMATVVPLIPAAWWGLYRMKWPQASHA